MHIGWHLSASGGFLKMGQTAKSAGADTAAFFTRNPRGGKSKTPDKKDIAAFCAFLAENAFAPLVVHAPYTMNLCSDSESVRDFSKQIFLEDISRLEDLPNQFYNFHPGSHKNQGIEKGIEMISQTMNEILTKNQKTTVLLETMAGKGSEVGSTFEELGEIIARIELKDKIGVCLDTCHIHDAGYEIADFDGILTEFDKKIGLEKLKAVHLNDSKNERGSRKDRHEKIGRGQIALESFARIVNHAALKNLPFILETPCKSVQEYAEEIALVRSLEK